MPSFRHKFFNEERRDKAAIRKERWPNHPQYNTSKWRQLRARVLNDCPYCIQCWRDKNQYVEASVADHIKDHHGDEKLFWDFNNLRSLCKRCHDTKNGHTLNAKRRAKNSRSVGEVL